MFLLVTIPTDSVIIEAGIFDQSNPFAPPRWDVAAVVLIEVFAKEGCRRQGERKEGFFQYAGFLLINSLVCMFCFVCLFL